MHSSKYCGRRWSRFPYNIYKNTSIMEENRRKNPKGSDTTVDQTPHPKEEQEKIISAPSTGHQGCSLRF